MKKIKLSLQEHQSYLYEILYMIDDFCKNYDIEYFLTYGTMLGAVRHHAIIPWDDDADIAMTRPNYERFVRLFREKTPEGYSIFDFYHEKWYDYPFAKIAKKNTFFRKGFFNQPPMGIFVDVFIIDGCGSDLQLAKKHFMDVSPKVFSVQFLYNGNPEVNFNMWKSKLLYYLRIRPIMIFAPIKKWYLNRIYKGSCKYSFEKSKFAANLVCSETIKELFPSVVFSELTKMKFGEREMPILANFDDYLTAVYGDYMTPLPPEERSHHGEGISYLLLEE